MYILITKVLFCDRYLMNCSVILLKNPSISTKASSLCIQRCIHQHFCIIQCILTSADKFHLHCLIKWKGSPQHKRFFFVVFRRIILWWENLLHASISGIHQGHLVWFDFVLWRINHCRLFNDKSIFIQTEKVCFKQFGLAWVVFCLPTVKCQNSSISSNSV